MDRMGFTCQVSPLVVPLQIDRLLIFFSSSTSDLTPLIPMLISLLSFETSFISASDVLQEILTSSSLSDGSGNKVLTEPLLEFMSTNGRAIYEQSLSRKDVYISTLLDYSYCV